MIIKKPRNREEAQIQEALVAWSRWVDVDANDKSKGKIFDYLIAIPNGGSRNAIEAASLKRQGVKAGVSDLFLAYPWEKIIGNPPSTYHSQYLSGLWLELKSKKGKTSFAQDRWLELMTYAGYTSAVAYSFEEAKQAILDYLCIPQ